MGASHTACHGGNHRLGVDSRIYPFHTGLARARKAGCPGVRVIPMDRWMP